MRIVKRLKERIKEFTNDTYGMLIFVSWIVLIACLVIKIFGGNWFELETENSKFIEFCTYVDETMWLKMLLACLMYILSTYPVLCIILNEKKLSIKKSLIFLPLMIIKSIVSWYVVEISYVIDFTITLFIPMFMNKKIKRPIFCVFMVLLFQVITLLFRNIGVGFGFNINNSFLIQVLFQVDYYLMILLFYLYNFKKKEAK